MSSNITYLDSVDVDGFDGDARDAAADVGHHVHRILSPDHEVGVGEGDYYEEREYES